MTRNELATNTRALSDDDLQEILDEKGILTCRVRDEDGSGIYVSLRKIAQDELDRRKHTSLKG